MADADRVMKTRLTTREFYDVSQVIKHLTDTEQVGELAEIAKTRLLELTKGRTAR